MPMRKPQTASLVLLGLLWLVSGCAHEVPVQRFPNSADLASEAKPVLDPGALTSDKALNDYDAAIEAWGQRGWLAVKRICLWAKDLGDKDAPC